MNFPVKLKHVMVLTGELSGDFHAGHLVRNLRLQNPDTYFSGIGGPSLKQQKVDLFFDIDQLSVMGVTEVLLQFRQIKLAYDLFKQKIKFHRPDLIILIDYPGFNLKAAKFAKEHYGIKILYYITPKVWAWKKSRLTQIKKYIDHAALILPFEESIFKNAGISATYVGNPLIDEYPEHITKPFQTIASSCDPRQKQYIIGLLPGSRRAEVDQLLPVMIQTGEFLLKKKDVRFLISKSDSIHSAHINSYIEKSEHKDLFKIYKGPVKEIFMRSDMVIAASGTVTLEAALCCIPTILTYRMSPVTYRIARFFVKLKYAGLANLIVNKEVMPEYLQDDATAPQMADKALEMLNDLTYFQTQLQMVRKFLGKKGASIRAAGIAGSLLRSINQ